MIEMRIQGVTTDRMTKLQIAWLEGVHDSLMFPVVVGGMEALTISSSLHEQPLRRPNAHGMMASVLDQFSAQVGRVNITEISGGVLKSEIVVKAEGAPWTLPARAADAVALAAMVGAPIYLSERIIARVGHVINKTGEGRLLYVKSMPESEARSEAVKDLTDQAPKEEEASDEKLSDRLKELEVRLAKAVNEERYEDAAKITREILKESRRGDEGAG